MEEYQKEFEKLSNPSTFPHEQLNIKEFFTFYYPNNEITFTQSIKVPIVKEVVDKVWGSIQDQIIELLNEQLKTNPTEEIVKELALKVEIEYNSSEYNIFVYYSPQSSIRSDLERLIIKTPLEFEIEHLKEQQKNAPTQENFDKQTKEIELLDNYLQDYIDEDTYREVQSKRKQIK